MFLRVDNYVCMLAWVLFVKAILPFPLSLSRCILRWLIRLQVTQAFGHKVEETSTKTNNKLLESWNWERTHSRPIEHKTPPITNPSPLPPIVIRAWSRPSLSAHPRDASGIRISPLCQAKSAESWCPLRKQKRRRKNKTINQNELSRVMIGKYIGRDKLLTAFC